MCGDLLLKFLKLYQKFRVLTERLNKEECDQFVNSTVEAVHKSSPIKNLFVDQYEDWKEFDLWFDPSHT